jgi:hypothetical protein
MFHYLYKTINPKNGKYYIGKHSTNNLSDGYQGSGKWVRDCLKAKTLIETSIIQMCNSEDEAYKIEEKLVEENICKPLCMNMVYGGIGWKSGEKNPWFNKKRSEETKRKISLSNSGKNHGMYGKKQSDFHRQRMKEVHIGKIVSEETKNKIGKSNLGKKRTEEMKKLKSISISGKSNPWFGKKRPEHGMKIKLWWAKKKGIEINAE